MNRHIAYLLKTRVFPRAALLALGLGFVAAPAQVGWRTTKSTNNTQNTGACTLENGSLRVKAFPAYLDVEEEVELRTSGTVSAANDANTLEITVTFTLPAGSAVTGALLWDGNRVLKANLLDRFKADSIYEELVDRDSVTPVPPPRPRDPIIIERTAANTYLAKIYPVALGSSRRFRLRYQLPPRIGAEGFEIRMQGVVAPQMTPATATVSTTIEGGGGVGRIILVEAGVRREVILPRTIFMARSSLTAATAAHATNSTRILPIDTLRQVQVKTSFGTGTGAYTGHYINLYASVGDSLLRALSQRVEVVVFWKWHNVREWAATPSHRIEAQSQTASLLTLYGQLGGPGNRVGLLHDDSYNARKKFAVASKNEPAYAQATDYLKSLQGTYIQNFVDNLQLTGGGPITPSDSSKGRFLESIQLVKTMYSPDQGVIRHLVMISAGPEYLSQSVDMNKAFDLAFQSMPVSISPVKNRSFSQVGFDFAAARQVHPIQGTVASLSTVDVPGFPAMSLIATVRNSQKAYDFNVACTGGVSIACGTLEFHGKSANPWNDTLSWEAYHSGGASAAGRAVTVPSRITVPFDTGMAMLWAASSTPFSESKEPLPGPAYGFVDQWASLLALERDSLSSTAKTAYADTGVARAGPIPDYLGPSAGSTSAVGAAGLPSSSAWRIERAANGLVLVRVPGLAAGARVEISLYDLTGKKLGTWNVVAEAGLLRWRPPVARSGTYLLQLRGPNLQGTKLILL